METLERIWDYTGHVVTSVFGGVERGLTQLFGSQNQRYVRRLEEKVRAIGALEDRMKALSDEELRAQTDKFRERLHRGETLDDILVEAFAVCREGGRRWLSMRHYDVQLIGGMVLHRGAIAEMVTGEGKTLVATLPAYLNAIEGRGVHVITVNDYLARRDMEWMAPLYMNLGLTVGTIQHDMSTDQRQKAYDADITYGTNNEFGFDYLRDNMKPAARGDQRYPKTAQQCQRPLNYAIIDEVDNILIDEARTPLIISGPAYDDPRKYAEADRIARSLKKETHFVVNEKDHTASLTDEGVRTAEKMAGVESFYTAGNMEWPHMVDNALKSHYLYKRDVNYVVEDGKVIIIDEFTGRKMDGRQWSDGLHQAVEAKEGVRIKEETQTLATITLQNYFKLYKKICGMTGTAMTEANEFWKIYKLDVVAIPTNRKLQRVEHNDAIYRTEEEKFEAVADEIERANKWDVVVFKNGDELWGRIKSESDESVVVLPQDSKETETVARKEIRAIERKGRPVLVGTVSIEKSERLSHLLDKRGIKHAVLNAKFHQREAEIIAQAGRPEAVTIATNMAGRGTDIILGGNPETLAWAQLQDRYPTRLEVPKEEWTGLIKSIEQQYQMKSEGEKIKTLGGLYVVGTERHESRRIDLQLRGRCGRQGDPGSSRFFLSLEDDLMRIFAGEWVKGILGRLGMQYKERIENSLITRRISSAQKKVEERNFEVRKNLLEYDEVMDEQRKRVYRFRQRLLDGADCREVIEEMIEKQIGRHVAMFLDRDYGVETFARYAGQELKVPFPNAKTFRGLGPAEAVGVAREEALHAAQLLINTKIEENLPDAGDVEDEDEDFDPQADWNWGALAKFMNTTFGTNYRDNDLKKHDRSELDDVLMEKAKEAIDRIDLTPGAVALEDDYGAKSLAAWLERTFDVTMTFPDHREREVADIRKEVIGAVEAAYDRKEAQFPILAAIYRFSVPGPDNTRQVDRAALTAWASDRFDTTITEADLTGKQRDEAIDLLVQRSTVSRDRAEAKLDEIPALVAAAGQGDAGIEKVVAWAADLGGDLTADEVRDLSDDDLTLALETVVSDRYHPEIRRMERQVLLELIDESWKNHLLMMDRIKSGIGYMGYAQLDPKVEYKREGMRIFEQMWESVGERATDLIFKVEHLPEDFIRSTWVEKKFQAKHDAPPTPAAIAAPPTTDIQRQQQAAIDASHKNGPAPVRRPIRNLRNERPGRNDPCYCGSGKKYKNCHMRMDDAA